MKANEAAARLRINRLLEVSGWRYFDDKDGPANVVLEPNTKITEMIIDALARVYERELASSTASRWRATSFCG